MIYAIISGFNDVKILNLHNNEKIWQGLGKIGLAAVIFSYTLGFAAAQSSSSSYKSVDFVNPEGSLSVSTSYKLNDSIDYYGGVHTSSGYRECTGDYAVLSNCGATPVIIPPTPPVEPSGGGGGAGPHEIHEDCNQVSCLGEPPVDIVTPPVEVPPVKEFKLPNIKEPQAIKTVQAQDEPLVKKENISVVKPLIKEIVISGKQLQSQIKEELVKVLSCSDNYCRDFTDLKGSAPKVELKKTSEVCGVYVFGGFLLTSSCDFTYLIIILTGLASLFVLPVSVFRNRRSKIKT